MLHTGIEIEITSCVSGVSNTILCMAQDCELRAPEDFVLSHVTKPVLRERYQQFMFKDHVKSHPELRFCPGPNCQVNKIINFASIFLVLLKLNYVLLVLC